MFFRGKQPEASIWRRFRASTRRLHVHGRGRRLHGARRGERGARGRPVVDADGAAQPRRGRRTSTTCAAGASGREKRCRCPTCATRSRGSSCCSRVRRRGAERLHARGPAALNPHLELFIYSRTDRWLYLLEGRGLEEQARVRPEELEDQSAVVSGRAGSGERRGRRGRATGAATRVIGPTDGLPRRTDD